VRRKDGRFATGVVHLWHPEVDRARLVANDARIEEVLRTRRLRAERGLSAVRGTSQIDEDDQQHVSHVRTRS